MTAVLKTLLEKKEGSYPEMANSLPTILPVVVRLSPLF